MPKHLSSPMGPTTPDTAPTSTSRQVVRLAHAADALCIPEATLRDLRFYSSTRFAANGQVVAGNGFARAFLKLGRSVYVDLTAFDEVWRSQQPKGDVNV